MPRPTANQKAFTLIEVLMAATVLVSFAAVIQAVAEDCSCQAVGIYLLSPLTGFVTVASTMIWTGYLGRAHTRTGVSCLAQNGRHLSRQR